VKMSWLRSHLGSGGTAGADRVPMACKVAERRIFYSLPACFVLVWDIGELALRACAASR